MNDQEFSGLTHEEILEMLPAFVVGALEPDEMLNVEEYIHAHPDLMVRVHELELAAAKLAYVAPAQPLSPDLHAKVIIRARASLPPRPQAAPAPTPAPRIVQQPAPRVTQEKWFSRWWRRRAFFDIGMVAAVAALILLGIVYRDALVQVNDLRAQLAGLQQDIAALQVRNTQLENENIRLQSELDTRLNQLASIGGAQEVVALSGTDAAPDASGTLYVHDNVGTLVLNNLGGLDESQTYQLWLIPPDGAPIPAGLLGQSGTGVQTLTLPTTLDSIAAVGVSVEPPGGSDAPTGPIVLLGEKA
jgi:anti-sigma-K factor RskA